MATILCAEGNVISGRLRISTANDRAKDYGPEGYTPNSNKDELAHFIVALALAEEKRISVYLEH